MKGFQYESMAPVQIVENNVHRQDYVVVLGLEWALESAREVWTYLYSIKSVFGRQGQQPVLS